MFSCIRPLLISIAVVISATAAMAQDPAEPAKPAAAEAPATAVEEESEDSEFGKLIKSLDWVKDGAGKLGGRASIKVPAGYPKKENATVVKRG